MRVEVRDFMTPELRKLAKKTRDLRPAMKKIELLIMVPLRERAWAASGLQSHSGELKKSVQAWSGKKSAGISVHPPRGRSLVIPKAVTHTAGVSKGRNTRKARYGVKAHNRAGDRVGRYTRRNAGSPWGVIKARPFIPTRLPAGEMQRAVRYIEDFIDV